MLLYNFVVRLYAFVIYVSSINNAKAKLWLSGRKDWRLHLKAAMAGLSEGKRVWFHCASYGEFEQGKPLIEALKRKDPSVKIILSFFSPSGYTSFSNWEGADYVCYLPLDTKKNARDFLAITGAQLIFFVKYEFWLNYLFEIRKLNLEAYLVSATFKDHHPFFKWYGSLFRQSLKSFRIIFLQDESSVSKLKEIGITNIQIAGDTRFDRVLQILEQKKDLPGFNEFKGNSFLIVAGSTWSKDEELLIATILKLEASNVKLIMAPHNLEPAIQNDTILKLEKAGISAFKYSDGIQAEKKVMILDTMGILSSVYRFGNVAYVGGGLSEGLHNTLEPAVYGIPVCFSGSGHDRFNEATAMINRRTAFLISDSEDLSTKIKQWMNHPEELDKIKKELFLYFSENAGVTEKILSRIKS